MYQQIYGTILFLTGINMLKSTLKYISLFSIFSLLCVLIYTTQYNSDSVHANNIITNSFNEKSIEGMYLEIPSINFKRPLYPLEDKRNDLEKNIIYVDSSSMPNDENGNVIIAGHNGNSPVSFFRYLHRLKLGEIVQISVEGIKYEYIIVNKYLVPKTGTVPIKRNLSKNTITLITCYGEAEQLILIGEIKKIIN